MILNNRIFFSRKPVLNPQHGGMLVELLLTVALAAIILPFVFNYQQNAVRRAENIAITNEMQTIQNALERYILENRERLLVTVGKSITRLELSELSNFGVSPDLDSGKYQVRILKSADTRGRATLQGIVIMTNPDITPLRTREIVSLGGNQLGFVDKNNVYGAFNAWHADIADLGTNISDGIIATTGVNRDNALYLWRIPSENAQDGTMQVSLNLGNHDITGGDFINSVSAQFDQRLSITEISAHNTIFQNKATISSRFHSDTATISGTLSSDSRNMEVYGNFNLADTGKFTDFTTGDLWTTTLTLGGLSVTTEDGIAVLKINNALDMNYGRIDAVYVTVGFTGSITPRLVVSNKILDSVNSEYYWDAALGRARFMDLSLAELDRMAPIVLYSGGAGHNTVTHQIFAGVVTNKNATASDYMNAITEIQKRVRAKYRLLNLE